MLPPVEAWDHFCEDFAGVVDRHLEERELLTREAEITRELKALEIMPSLPPAEELAEIEERVMADLAAEEEAIARRVIAQNSHLSRVPETWRRNGPVGHGVTARAAARSAAWRKAESEPLWEFAATRTLYEWAFTVTRERIEAGEVEGPALTGKEQFAESRRLAAELEELRGRLTEIRAADPWRFDARHDHLPRMLAEYREAQGKCTFPITPEGRLETSAAYRGINNDSHDDADMIRLTDPERLEAWRKLEAAGLVELDHEQQRVQV